MAERVADREKVKRRILVLHEEGRNVPYIAKKVDREESFVRAVLENAKEEDQRARYNGAREVGINGVAAYRQEGSDKWVSLPLIPSLHSEKENPEYRRVVSRFQGDGSKKQQDSRSRGKEAVT